MSIGTDATYTIISCYLPQSGLGITRFQNAIQSTRNLILSVPAPYRRHLLIGCDANCSLAVAGPDDHLVGPNTFVTSNGPRAALFMDLLLEFSVRAANTFGTSGDVRWTHEWYPDKTVHSVIDYVLVSSSLESSCTVDYKLDCATDHRPLALTLSVAAPASRRHSRKPFSKGWRPANLAAAEKD